MTITILYQITVEKGSKEIRSNAKVISWTLQIKSVFVLSFEDATLSEMVVDVLRAK